MDQMHYEHLKELYQLSELLAAQGESGVLFCLRYANRPMLPGELMNRMGLTTGRVANILKRLEEKALVQRIPDAKDRRRVHVSLTPEGAAAAEREYRDIGARHARLLAHLGPDDAAELLRLMERCLEWLASQN